MFNRNVNELCWGATHQGNEGTDAILIDTIGGFSNRSGYEIWNGTGAMSNVEGFSTTMDNAIALSHKTATIAPGRSGATVFSYATAFSRDALVGEPGGGGETGAGIGDQKTVDFAIYPNPVQRNEFTLQVEGRFAYTIIDASGKIVLADTANGTTLVDVQSLDKGFYFITIDQQGVQSTQKLILK